MTSLQVMRWNQNGMVCYMLVWYGMVWYVSTWYDVSIMGYCRVWYGMLVWYGVLEWYDVSMLWFVILFGRVS